MDTEQNSMYFQFDGFYLLNYCKQTLFFLLIQTFVLFGDIWCKFLSKQIFYILSTTQLEWQFRHFHMKLAQQQIWKK